MTDQRPSDTTPAPTRSLDGLRVLDFTAMMAGPYCTRWLSDLGAEVIKIESPQGDYIRSRGPSRDGCSAYFGHLNAGKKSVVIDLKDPDGVALARELATHCDVVIEAYRPGVMERLGLGAASLRALQPRLIYCSISGFGQTSSIAHHPAYAPVVHAASGYYMANFDYQDHAERPANSGIPIADMVTAIFAAFSIQNALLTRERTGEGCHIDVNLMDSMMSLLPFELQSAQFPMPERRPLYQPLRARDGFILVAPVNEKNFHSVCEATGHPEWRDDPLLNSDQGRYDNWSEYMRRIEEWAIQHSALECEHVFMQAGVPCSRYKRVAETIREPQFEERQSFATIQDDAGTYFTARLPFAFDAVKPTVGARVSALGEDTRTVLASVLGLTSDRIQTLARQGTVVTP